MPNLKTIPTFSNLRVAIVGDLVIDEMIYGHTARLSREAPVVILKHAKTDCLLGAAGNAAHNVAALGAKRAVVVAVSGQDYDCTRLMEALARDGIEPTGLVPDPSRPTTTKTRVSGIANHSVTQQIVRIDRESKAPVSAAIEAKLIAHLTTLAPELDAILLSDYGLGVVTPAVIAACRQLAQQHGLVWAVDSQQDLRQFTGADVLTPNQPEAEANLGYTLDTLAKVESGGFELLGNTGAKALLLTRGAEGMSLFTAPTAQHAGEVTHIPVFNRSKVFDVTGAGDTVVATFTLALAAGATGKTAATLGNLAASIVVRQFGAAVTTPDELQHAMAELEPGLIDSIVTKHRDTIAS
jgi:rfaE bifunctional protein kinase chain/domain